MRFCDAARLTIQSIRTAWTHRRDSSSAAPDLSLVLATRAGGEMATGLAARLAELAGASGPRLEILWIHGGDERAIQSDRDAFLRETPGGYIHRTDAAPTGALWNQGVYAARGLSLYFCDGGHVPGPGRLVSHQARPRIGDEIRLLVEPTGFSVSRDAFRRMAIWFGEDGPVSESPALDWLRRAREAGITPANEPGTGT
jgi:hypothetical protein